MGMIALTQMILVALLLISIANFVACNKKPLVDSDSEEGSPK